MRFSGRLVFSALLGLCFWTCNLSDSRKQDTLTFHLDDSLKTSSGKYDSIRLDLYIISGQDTTFSKTIFHGIYNDPKQIANLSIGEGLKGNFVIRVVAYRNKQEVLVIGVPFTNGKAVSNPIVYRLPGKNRAPILSFQPAIFGDGISVKEGVTFSLKIVAHDSDLGDSALLLGLLNPPWPQFGSGKFDSSVGLLTFKPGFNCVASGESTLSTLIFRARDNASNPDTVQISISLKIADSNSAPRWSTSSKNLNGKEGVSFSENLKDIYLGDAENDPVEFASTCGSIDEALMGWTFHPGFRDAGQKDCDIYATDNHIPSATSKITLKLNISDSARLVDVAILSPLQGFATKDSLIKVGWKVGDQQQFHDTLELLQHEGLNIVRRTIKDSLGNVGADSIKVYLDTKPPLAPIVSTNPASPTNNLQPAWTWKTGGSGGSGVFRYKLGDGNFAKGAFQGKESSYSPAFPLGEGNQTLFVQEIDSVGNWSASSIATIVVDITRPNPPLIRISKTSPTLDRFPIFTWGTGGKGDQGVFRYKLDDSTLSIGAKLGKDTTFRPEIPGLTEGKHILYVQELDSAGNWSALASKSILIDFTPPAAPKVQSSALHTTDLKPTWLWSSGGSGGNGIYRFQLDDSVFKAGISSTSATSFIPPLDLIASKVHTLFVEEQDSAGNWSASGHSKIHIHGKIGFAVGSHGAIIKSLDGGATWDTIPSGLSHYPYVIAGESEELKSVVFTDFNTGYAVGSHGLIIKTLNGGADWTRALSGTTENLLSVCFPDPETGYTVSDKGQILKTRNSGLTWDSLPRKSNQFLASILFVNPNKGIAVGGMGTILTTDNGGLKWDSVPSPTKSNLLSAFFTDENIGYIVGAYGTILKTKDGGANWTVIASGTSEWLRSIYFVNKETGYAAGGPGLILKTTDGGDHWTVTSSGRTDQLQSLFFTDAVTGNVLGSSLEIGVTVDAGNSWNKFLLSIIYTGTITHPGGIDENWIASPTFNSLYFP